MTYVDGLLSSLTRIKKARSLRALLGTPQTGFISFAGEVFSDCNN